MSRPATHHCAEIGKDVKIYSEFLHYRNQQGIIMTEVIDPETGSRHHVRLKDLKRLDGYTELQARLRDMYPQLTDSEIKSFGGDDG